MSHIIKYGLNSDDWKLKNQTLQIIVQLLKLDLSYTANISEMKKILEKVIALLKDTSAIVSETAKEVCNQLKETVFDFNEVFSKLSYGLQQIYKEKCGDELSYELPTSRVSVSPIKSVLERPDKRTSTYAFRTSNINMIANAFTNVANNDFLKESAKNGLIYGFIPHTLMSQLNDTTNWRNRVNAIQEIENIISAKTNFTDIFPFTAVLFRFLNNLLDDPNFKVMLSALTIIYFIVSVTGISSHANIAQIIPGCLRKLGDNKIAVRQAAFKVFKALTQEVKPRILFPQLIDALSSSNWHVREEALNVIITAILLAKENYDYDFLSLVLPMAKLLDDPKTKIRFVTIEALTVLANTYGLDVIDDILKPIIDHIALESLHKRFIHKVLPVVREDYVEFPRTIPSSAPLISSPYLKHSEFRTTPSSVRTVTAEQLDMETSNLSHVKSRIVSNKGSVTRLRSSSEMDERFPNASNVANLDESLNRSISKRKVPRRTINMSQRPEIFKEPEKQFVKAVKLNYATRHILKRDFDVSPIKAIKGHRRGNSEDSDIGSISRSSPLLSKTKISSEFGNSDLNYSGQNDIQPLKDPENALKEFNNAARMEDWSAQLEGLMKIRCLLRYHSEVFAGQINLHNVFLEVVKLSESLRSSLSKNGVIVLGEMCEYLGRSMDSEIPDLLKILVKRASDTNIFLAEQAQMALLSMCKFTNENKLANALLNKLQTAKNPAERATIAICFVNIFEKIKSSIMKMKEIEKIMTSLGSLLQDASSDVRNAARKAFSSFELWVTSEQERERLLSRCLPETTQKKLRDTGKFRDRTESPFSKRKTQSEFRPSNEPTQVLPIKQPDPEIQQFEIPEELLKMSEDMGHTEWKVRYEIVGKVSEFLSDFNSEVLILGLGILAKGMTDQNLKVQIHSLNCLIKIVPSLRNSLVPHLSIIISSLVPGLGSGNSSIREIAKEASNTLLSHCEHHAIILPLSFEIHNGNPRAKIAIIGLIIDAIHKTNKKRPGILAKHILPLAYKMMDEGKEEIRTENKRLLKKLFEILDNEVISNASVEKAQRIIEVLNEE